MERYEEHTELSDKASWIFLALFSVFILGWGMILMCMVSDAPREWDFGVLPDTPGESIYSTVTVAPSSKPAIQVAPLPDALPSKVNDNGGDDSVEGPTR
jgi:hypothetical protein